MSWDDLRVLVAIADTGSMRRAAERLGVNPSTVSRRLGGLEDALQTRLFDRHPDGLELSGAGEEVLAVARRLHEDVAELQRVVGGRDQRLRGTVRITAAEIMGAIVGQALVGVVEAHPQLDLELTVSDTMADLDRHEEDVAVRVADAPPDHLVGRRIGYCSVGLFASCDYVRTHGDTLADPEHQWVAWPRALSHKPAFRWVEDRYPDRRTVLRANSALSVLHAVRSGLGIAPLAHAQRQPQDGLVPLATLPSSCSTALWLLTHRDTRRTARTRAVLDHLGRTLGEHTPSFCQTAPPSGHRGG